MTISAKIIADSISSVGVRITTFELEFPRIILAEFNTHRVLSRNAASTRAIPVKTQLELLDKQFFEPAPFTKNQPGMTANEPVKNQSKASDIWRATKDFVIQRVQELADMGVSKQHAGRLSEAFAHIKVICTATEYDNFFLLRNHPDAQPEIQELAKKMLAARVESKPVYLDEGEWHVPYYKDGYWKPYAPKANADNPLDGFTLDDALIISASCCAQVSYRKLDDSLEKAKRIYDRLVGSVPRHSSPFEHQATPMVMPEPLSLVPAKGTTHYCIKEGRGMVPYSGNFREWIQYRQLID